MDPKRQDTVKKLAEQYGRENLMVLLGFVDVELIEIYALTLTSGDPSGAGPLSGVALRLPVYHIFEPEIKSQIPEEIYNEQVLFVEISASENLEKIIEVLKGVRT